MSSESNQESVNEVPSTTVVEKDIETQSWDALKVFTAIMGESTERTVKAINAESLLDNVAIFVDYDNIYWTLKKLYNHDPDHSDPSKNLFHALWSKYGQDNVRTFRVYADFQNVRSNLTNLQKNRVQVRHVYSNGKDGENRKNSSDIELCIDAIENTYKDPNITTYVFVTADSDMIPILSRMMYKGKRVELFYLSDAAPKYVDMRNYVHDSSDLIDFLNIEKITYNLEDYLVNALSTISDWHRKYGNSDKFLGKTWLKGELSKVLSIPEVDASQLIEKMELEKLIISNSKKSLPDGTQKAEVALTDEGQALLPSKK